MRAFPLIALLLVACGTRGAATRVPETPKLPPIKKEALRAFDDARRASRLGGTTSQARAIERYKKAVLLDSNLWEGHYNLGLVLAAAGEDQQAEQAFSAALEINPSHASSLAARAETRRSLGKISQAEDDYRKLLEWEPTKRQHYARLASLFRASQKYDDGLTVLRDALRVAGADSRIYVELGLIYLAQGQDDMAELILNKAALLDSKDATILNALAFVALSRGNDQLAFQRFDAAYSAQPNFLDPRFNTATILIDAGDYGRAKTVLEELTAAAPDDFGAQVALGVALRGVGDFGGAEKLWTDVVDRAPKRSKVRGDALYNLAILAIDFKMDEKLGVRGLKRYLRDAPRLHPQRTIAEEREKDLQP